MPLFKHSPTECSSRARIHVTRNIFVRLCLLETRRHTLSNACTISYRIFSQTQKTWSVHRSSHATWAPSELHGGQPLSSGCGRSKETYPPMMSCEGLEIDGSMPCYEPSKTLLYTRYAGFFAYVFFCRILGGIAKWWLRSNEELRRHSAFVAGMAPI